MTQKLLYLLPLFLLSGCGQATYKNASLPAEERAGLLLKELTLEEKVSLMMDSSKPVERLGIKPYNWWNEALHGVARAGLATVFPQPIGMAASFSPETVYEVFTAVSDEARAKNAYYTSQESHERYQGLTEPVKPETHSLDFQYGATYSLRCGSVLGIMKASMPSLFNNARRASIR